MTNRRAYLELLQALNTQFSVTNDNSYLHNAIWITEGMIASNPPGEYTQVLELVLSGLVDGGSISITLEQIEKATQPTEETVSIIVADCIDLPGRLNYLSTLFHERFQQTRDLDDVGKAIQLGEKAVSVTPSDHPKRAARLHNLSNIFYSRFEWLGDVDDLNHAIQRKEEAVESMPPDQLMLDILDSLTDQLNSRFEMLDGLDDLEKSIRVSEDAVARTPQNHPKRANRLSVLSLRYQSRFQRLGDIDDLDRAIRTVEEALAETPPDHPHRLDRLGNQGCFFSIRFDQLGRLEDLEKAVDISEEVIASTPQDHPARGGRLCNLSNTFHGRFQRLGRLEDLERSIQASEEAVEVIPIDDPDRAGALNVLSVMLNCRFGRLGAADDLERAIWASEEAVAATPADHPDLFCRLDTVSSSFHNRFELSGDLEDLAKAIAVSEEALDATPFNHPDRGNILNNLGYYLSSRFSRLGDEEDIETAISASVEAVAETPTDHPDRPHRLSNLGQWLSLRFDRFGDLEDLDNAIQASEEGVAGTHTNHADRPGRLSNLSNNFLSRFQRLGALDDLERAIQFNELAVAEIPLDHPDRAWMLGNLSIKFHHRFERSGALEALEQAIQVNEEAIATTSPSQLHRAAMLDSLSNQLHSRFQRLGDLSDLEKAILSSEEAIATTSSDHPLRVRMLKALGKWFQTRYTRLGFLDDLTKALQASEDAAAEIPRDHPDRGNVLLLLAQLLHSRFEQTNSHADLQRAGDIALEAWGNTTSPPRVRIRVAWFAAYLLVSVGGWNAASALVEDAVKSLPEVSPQFLGRDDHEHILSEFSQLAAVAISIALQAGSTASHCLSLLELGRGIIMGFTIDCRSDLSELRVKNQDIFDQLNRLRIEIDSPLMVGGSYHSKDEDRRRRRVQAITEIDETLLQIRELPGFARFQLPPLAEDLIALAADGPIVVFVSTKLRSDAIIVSTVIKSLPLPKMIFSEVKDRMAVLARVVRGKRSTYPSRNQEMERVLLWLWEVAVKPVLDELQFGVVVNGMDKLPRIWWIGVGPLATAPFHAAGDHSHGSTVNTISRAISSYIPTIKALSYARQKKLELSGALLLVTMPKTPDTPAIPAVLANPGTPAIPGSPPVPATSTSPAIPRTYGSPAIYRTLAIPGINTKKWKKLENATKEVDEIIAAVKEGSNTKTTRLDFPRATHVLEKLPAHNAIHFACHGLSDGKNPSNSHLLLHGTSGPEKLTVGAISSMNIRNAQVAYLSACCTAENASDTLADESIHIASGFQLAGFSHVLATLWESNDDACRRVAGEFYRSLYGQGDQEHRAVSVSFHLAVEKLRKDYMRQPLKWASFIHTGA